MAITKRNMIGSILYMTRSIDRMCSGYRQRAGIPASQARVLCFIAVASEDHDIYQKDLEEEFAIRASSATGLLQALEQQGLIRRESVSGDGRLKKIVLSARGCEIRSRIFAVTNEIQQQLQGNLSEEEIAQFLRQCEVITRNANQQGIASSSDSPEISL
ncbi:MAG: MarR family winged helix-turn-helix transcriptional regulator [Victivallaceae bacterium]|nr:MarR family winged helix-turn-helix transcriptional regulator [Victivallaceae bacterium]